MPTDLIRLDLLLRRRMLIGTALGAAAYLFLIVASYSSFKSDSSFDKLIAANPAAAAAFGINGSITSPDGWLGANMYANLGPLLGLLLTIGYGAAAIAGQDTDGTLGLVATLPLTRARILGEKAATLLLVALVVPLVSYAVCLAGPRFSLHPDWGSLLGVTLTSTLLTFGFGAVALFVGAATGSRGAALGVAAGLAAAAYLVSSLAGVVHVFHTLRWVSPFYWAVGDNQIADGIGLGQVALLLGIGLILVAAAYPAFRRLDLH